MLAMYQSWHPFLENLPWFGKEDESQIRYLVKTSRGEEVIIVPSQPSHPSSVGGS